MLLLLQIEEVEEDAIGVEAVGAVIVISESDVGCEFFGTRIVSR